jgi:hypothetical protein
MEASMAKKLLWLTPFLISAVCVSQDIQINRQNKTIAVTADESTVADAEVAVLAIGYHNYGPTQDYAFHRADYPGVAAGQGPGGQY